MTHLRAVYYDDLGQELPRGSLSTAIMPSVRLPGVRRRAQDLLRASDSGRLAAATLTMLAEVKRAHNSFAAVAFIRCPGARAGDGEYQASFAARAASGEVLSGEVSASSLPRMLSSLRSCVARARVVGVGAAQRL